MNKPKRPWGLTLVAVALILLGPALLLKGLDLALDGKYAQSAGATTQGAVNIATGILIFLHRKAAILLSGICAVLFTIACVVHGLSLIDIISVVLVWMGFSWYRSWRTQVIAPAPMPLTEEEELAQKHHLETFMGMSHHPSEKDQ
jgi:hypothetical protein